MSRAYRNIARVVRAHGSKGEVLVAPLRGLPFLLAPGMSVCLTPPALRRERFSLVEDVRRHPEGALVRLSCAHDIGDAQAIAGCTVLARSEDVALGPLDASFESLIGRTVVDVRRGELGRIEEIIETPAHAVWSVSGGAFGEVLIPVVEEAVPAIPAEGPIAVRLMDGLIES